MLVFHGSRLFFTVPYGFYGFSWFQAGFYGSRLVFMVSGWFLCFFFQDSRLVFHGLRWVFWLFKVPVWLFMVSCRFLYFFQGSRSVFHGARSVFMVFSRFQVDFSWFKVVFHGFFLWFQVWFS